MSIIDFLKLHGTKVLGFLGATIGVLAVADPSLVGGDKAIKYFLLLQSLLTVWRGFFTSDAFKMGLVMKAENADKAATIMKDQQGGFARLLFIALLFALAIPVFAVMSGCAGTALAYKQAQSPDEFAFVLSEHYASLVNEAATLKERGSASPSQIAAMQAADRAAKPQVLKLRELRDAYLAVKNATTEQDLQRAIDDAVLLVADLVRSVKAARGTGTSSLIEQRILLEAEVLERSPA